MNNNYWKVEFGKENAEEVREECLNIIGNIRNVINIRGLEYIETFIRLVELKEK